MILSHHGGNAPPRIKTAKVMMHVNAIRGQRTTETQEYEKKKIFEYTALFHTRLRNTNE